jgi:hypothetical protein
METFAGGELNPNQFRLSPARAVSLFADCLQSIELELIIFQDNPYYLARDSSGHVRLLSARSDSPVCISDLPLHELLTAARRAVASATVSDSALLAGFDTYYYDDPTYSRPLPVVRVRFNDPQHTWLYINPGTGRIQAKYTAHARQQRWLYEGLHDLHFPFLFRHRRTWRLTVLGLCFGGLVLSVTSIILAQRYLKRLIKQRLYSRPPVQRALLTATPRNKISL